MRYLKRLLVALAAAVTLSTFAAPAIAFAQDSGGDKQAPLVVEDVTNYVVSPMHWSIIIGAVLPFFVGLITKYAASDRAKALIGILVAFLAALVERATLIDGSAVFTWALVVDVALVYIPQALTYARLWRPLFGGDLNAKLAPTIGIG